MENQEEVNTGQHSIKWGVILGLVSIIITLIIYLIDITMMVDSYMPFVLLIIFLGITIYAGRDYRSKIGGYMSFKEAFLNAFVILAVGIFIGTVFDYVLYNFIDPEIIPILVEVQMENTMKVMEAVGGGSNTEMMDGMAEGVEKGFSLQGQALGYIWKLVLCAIGALIVGGINKKKNKEEEF
jgi:uncharacterized membrane protein